MNLKIISAGAGSGKTYRLTQEMVGLLASGAVRPSGIIATTFTNKAAAELQERVRVKLLEDGMVAEADGLGNALIGTVHGLGVKLLKRFSFEAGVSPQVDIMAEEDQQVMFNQSLAMVLTNERVGHMEELAEKLGFNKSIYNTTDWRKLLLQLTEIARSNNFSAEVLEKSKQESYHSFSQFFSKKIDKDPAKWKADLENELTNAITNLENNGDTTKVTEGGLKTLKEAKLELGLRGELFWHQWVKLAKVKVGAKSRDDVQDLVDFANAHLGHEGFHNDIQSFISLLFEIAQSAIDEYSRYKLNRGLIDYTDMEVLVNNLLDNELVKSSLQEELDLLMVDEFQDTSPLQLEIFLKISKLANHAVWVGDPKQSIYGFRGADPKLMLAIIEKAGGLKKENILEHSWRSREDIVHACNAIFTRAFEGMPEDQVALKAKRCKQASEETMNKQDEPEEMGNALIHWHFEYGGEGRKPGRSWLNQCIALNIKKMLAREMVILPKGGKDYRKVQPGDIAILCRSNNQCLEMADALHQIGLNVAISRAGLLSTPESKLILACLKLILNPADSLSIAEVRLLASATNLEEIVKDRLEYINREEAAFSSRDWGSSDGFVSQLINLRSQVVELSSTEILALILDEMALNRIIASWGNVDQRFSNIDVLTKLSHKYEEACNRLHTAASLGGFLLWLNELEDKGLDMQGAGENPLAVNVLTYHKSKGLEYPVVICGSMDQQLRDDVWGLNIISESAEIDLDNLLGNRWLRLWVNPYADLFSNTLLAERIDESAPKAEKKLEVLSEEARVLYVGMTRARDYLVLPTYHKAPIWLNRVYHSGTEERNVLDASFDISVFEWKEKPLAISVEVDYYDSSEGQIEPKVSEAFILNKPSGRETHRLYKLENFEPSPAYKLTQSNYHSKMELPDVIERQLVGKALVAFFNAEKKWSDSSDATKIANQLIVNYKVDMLASAEDFVSLSNAFDIWIKQEFGHVEITKNYPMRVLQNGQFFRSTIDWMIEYKDGWAIVLNSPFVGDLKGMEKYLKESSGKLKAIKDVFLMNKKEPSVRLYIHFVLCGVVYQVEFSK